MPVYKYANFAFSTLQESITSIQTTLTISADDEAKFPSLGAGDVFFMTIWDRINEPEIVLVTARTGELLTVVRGQDGTSNRAWLQGTPVRVALVKGLFDAIQSAVDLSLYVPLSQKGAASGVAPLGTDGKINTSYLPALNVSDIFTTASEASMLALAADQGDICIRTDVNKTFVLASNNPTILADWHELLALPSVTSVAGKTGAVVLVANDITDLTASAKTLITSGVITADGLTLLKLANYAAMFQALKVDATQAVSGTVEQLTDAEALTGTDTTRYMTAANLTAKYASAADYRANTAQRVLTPNGAWASQAEVALTDAATVAVDMSLGFNFTLAINGNRTLGQPTNTKIGQSGVIAITKVTAGQTLAYHADWKFNGGTDPVLSNANTDTDLLYYRVIRANFIHASLNKAVA